MTDHQGTLDMNAQLDRASACAADVAKPDDIVETCDEDARRVRDLAVFDDLQFVEAWENGLVPWLSAYVRVRQIRRANASILGL